MTATSYVNWILKCPRHGAKCLKKRHVNVANTRHRGDIEPVAYLHAWVPHDPEHGKTHSNRCCNPSQEEANAYADARSAELRGIVDRMLL